MNLWSKALYTSLGAAVGAGVVYYVTQKDTEKFKRKLDTVNNKTEQGCDAVREWFSSDKKSTNNTEIAD